MSDYMTQRRALDAALAHIRRVVPTAMAVELTTSDQGHYGFWLSDVTVEGQQPLSQHDPILLGELVEEVYDYLCDLDWDCAVGEDEQGHASIPLGN